MATTDSRPYIVGLVLDFETGGLPKQELPVSKIAITQVAIHAVRLDTFEKLGTYIRYIYPYTQKEMKGTAPKRKTLKSKYEEAPVELMTYQQEALNFTKITMDMLYEQGVQIQTVAQDIIKFVESVMYPKTPRNMKPVIIGQNITFDEAFLIQMFEYAGLTKELAKLVRGWTDFYGNWHPSLIDTIHLAQLTFCNNPDVSSYTLESICERLGVELVDAHDADADVQATTNVTSVITQRMRNADGGNEEALAIGKVEKSRKHFKI